MIFLLTNPFCSHYSRAGLLYIFNGSIIEKPWSCLKQRHFNILSFNNWPYNCTFCSTSLEMWLLKHSTVICYELLSAFSWINWLCYCSTVRKETWLDFIAFNWVCLLLFTLSCVSPRLGRWGWMSGLCGVLRAVLSPRADR